jgi:DNA invertase Pin-like site-specific DNA recombinase
VKAALAAKKARGEPLGTNIPNVRRAIPKAVQKSKEAVQTEADAFAEFMRPNIERMRKAGMSVNAIAADLNKYGTKTARGKQWYAKTVCNLMERLQIS